MAYDNQQQNNPEELRKQQQVRQALARRQQRFLRRFCGICVGVVALLVLCVALVRSCERKPDTSTTLPATTQPSQTTAPSQPPQGQTVISIVAGGDVNVTDQVIAAGETAGGYDFSHLFMDVLPLFANADAAIVNFEGNLVGAPYGSQNASAPLELMQALKQAGVDLVQMANSYSIKNGILGLNTTLERIRQTGLEPVGACSSQEEYERTEGFTIKNINGVRVALVAFTKGMGGLSLPSGSQNRVNLLYQDYATSYRKIDEEGIQATLAAVEAQQPDVTIALLHWGSEHKSIVSDNQKTITKLMLDGGVDAIIGTHSHYVQGVDFDPESGTVVAYSLGDLLGDGTITDTNYSIVLQLQITKDHTTGQTRITDCGYTPVYMLTQGRDGVPLRLVRLETAMAMYENNHVDRVSLKAYENMKTAMSRIKSKTAAFPERKGGEGT